MRSFTVDTSPPDTTITSGPNGTIKNPAPAFAFASTEADSTFECRVDSGPYQLCGSPHTTAHLADGSHTFSVRAIDPAGNADPTPASRSFTVRTGAAVGVSGSTLTVTALPGTKDNLQIKVYAPSKLRVTNLAAAPYTGSELDPGPGCTRVNDVTVNCNSAGVTLIQVTSGDLNDKVVSSTAIPSSLDGGPGIDTVIGGGGKDTDNRRPRRRHPSGDGAKRPAEGPTTGPTTRRSTAMARTPAPPTRPS